MEPHLDLSKIRGEGHSRSCWVNCSFITHWFEALCLTCFTKDLPVWKDNGNEFYIVNNYKFNQQTYSFPIRIEKNKTSTFLKAFEVVQTSPGEYKETKNMTDLVKQWLGPNQDFYDKVITPNLLGVSALKVCFVDLESFDTIDRIFTSNEAIVLAPEIAYRPPSPRITNSISLYDTVESYQNDSPDTLLASAPCGVSIKNDPREPFPLRADACKEPRNSFSFDKERFADSHIR